MILASRNTYQKLSSNGLDLAELRVEKKPVGHRRIPIGPLQRHGPLLWGKYQLDLTFVPTCGYYFMYLRDRIKFLRVNQDYF
jgi:hypothetical protein